MSLVQVALQFCAVMQTEQVFTKQIQAAYLGEGLRLRWEFYRRFYRDVRRRHRLAKRAMITRRPDPASLRLICTLPRSGTNLCWCLVMSYVEMLNGGDGEPKYRQNDSWAYTSWGRWPMGIKNGLFGDPTEFDSDAIITTHHPVQPSELIDVERARPVILIRDPIEVIVSWYWQWRGFHGMDGTSIDAEHVIDITDRIVAAFNYWHEFTSTRREGRDWIMVHYCDLVDRQTSELCRILEFFDIPVQDELVQQSARINDRERHRQKAYSANPNSLRMTTPRNPDLNDEIREIAAPRLARIVNGFGYARHKTGHQRLLKALEPS